MLPICPSIMGQGRGSCAHQQPAAWHRRNDQMHCGSIKRTAPKCFQEGRGEAMYVQITEKDGEAGKGLTIHHRIITESLEDILDPLRPFWCCHRAAYTYQCQSAAQH